MSDPPLPHRPDQVGGGLPHERTALAWERTAIGLMVSGAVLARHGAITVHVAAGLVGIAEVVAGGALLAWAGRNDAMLHDPSRPASAVPQVGLTRAVGLTTVVVCAVALVFGVIGAFA